MIRFLFGAALLPSSALTLWAAARALGAVAAQGPSAIPFLAGLALSAAVWSLRRCWLVGEEGPARWASAVSRRAYVFGHELTHAVAAWGSGAKVLDFEVGEDGGHVDLSHSSALIALAPYCVPIYTLFVVLGYRVLLWCKPEAGGRAVFLAAIGVTLSFHLLKTFEALWDQRQPDLAAAEGVVFSIAWIALANGLVLLLLLKGLFPAAVRLAGSLREVGLRTRDLWVWAYDGAKPLAEAAIRKVRR